MHDAASCRPVGRRDYNDGVPVEFTCERLTRSFETRHGGALVALDEVSFSARQHEFVSIVGPSGCGKTTLLRLVAGLIAPTSGRVDFGAPPSNGQQRAALVFQEHGLFPWKTVLDNVVFGVRGGHSLSERRERARCHLSSVGLAAFAAAYPHELSVGMRQRVGVARALVADPRVLMMDEPFGSLDAQTRLVLQEELVTALAERPRTVVYVTHDIEEAVTLGDRVLVMSGRPGRILESIPVPLGRPRDLLGGDRADVRAIKRHIWDLLEADVRSALQ